ncbi:MAG TPA: hypothetical protein VFL12_00025, partial [Thermoanaerobaculia bacterium]|nr:hypothetical protein [Thermoanaerobaculia bacterium]
FERITRPLGLAVVAPPAERYFRWIWPRYEIRRPEKTPYFSSEILLAGAGRTIGLALSGGRDLDLRWIGATHAAALLAAVILLWRESGGLSLAGRAAAFGFGLFAFTDVGYVAPLNSFYTQTGSLVYLAWTIALAVAAARRPGRIGPLAGYFAAAALFVTSKPQESVAAIPLAGFGLFLAFRGPRGPRRTGVAAAAVLALGAVGLAARTHHLYREGALYKMVFYEILPASPDPDGDLRLLGLPAADRAFAGTTTYRSDSPFQDPATRAGIFSSLGYGPLLRLYAARPARALRELSGAARAGWELRPGFGNFPKAAGFPPGARSSAYSAWSRIRRIALPAAGFLLLLVFAGNAAVAALGRLPDAARAGIATLVALGVFGYGLCALASAHIEIVRKLYVFHAVTDVLIATDLAVAVSWLEARH